MKSFEQLVSIADILDQRGLHKEAGLVDLFLYKQGALFSHIEKAVTASIERALNELLKYSIISEPTESTAIYTSTGRELPLGGNVINRLLLIQRELSILLDEVIVPNAKHIPDHTRYQAFEEFTRYLQQAIDKQRSRLISTNDFLTQFKEEAKEVQNALQGITVNPAFMDDVPEVLDEIRQEYVEITKDLDRVTRKGNLPLEDFQGMVDALTENVKLFVDKQNKSENGLSTLFEEAKIRSGKRPDTEHTLKWIIDQARNSSNEQVRKLGEYWKSVNEARRNAGHAQRRSRGELQKALSKFLDTYEHCKYEPEVREVFPRGIDSLKARIEEQLNQENKEDGDEDEPETVASSQAGIVQKAEEFSYMQDVPSEKSFTSSPGPNYTEDVANEYIGTVNPVDDVLKWKEKVEEASKKLDQDYKRWEKLVAAAVILRDTLSGKIKDKVMTEQTKKKWDSLKKQILDGTKILSKYIKVIEKNDKIVKDALFPAVTSYARVIDVLFKR